MRSPIIVTALCIVTQAAFAQGAASQQPAKVVTPVATQVAQPAPAVVAPVATAHTAAAPAVAGVPVATRVAKAPAGAEAPVRGELIQTAAAGTTQPAVLHEAPPRHADDGDHPRHGTAMLLAALALMSGIALRRYGGPSK